MQPDQSYVAEIAEAGAWFLLHLIQISPCNAF